MSKELCKASTITNVFSTRVRVLKKIMVTPVFSPSTISGVTTTIHQISSSLFKSEYTVAGRGDSEDISLPNLHWEMPGRLHSIVLPLDQGFPNRNFVTGEVSGYAQIYFPAYSNSLCQTYDYIGLIRECQLGRSQGDAGEILGRFLGGSWEIGS